MQCFHECEHWCDKNIWKQTFSSQNKFFSVISDKQSKKSTRKGDDVIDPSFKAEFLDSSSTLFFDIRNNISKMLIYLEF